METETEYVDRIVEKEVYKTYASPVTFTATSDEEKVNITMTTETEGATIYYTTDGTAPSTESTAYTGIVAITADTTFKAIAVKDGIENSPVSFAKISISTKTVTETRVETQYVEKIVTETDTVYVDTLLSN